MYVEVYLQQVYQNLYYFRYKLASYIAIKNRKKIEIKKVLSRKLKVIIIDVPTDTLIDAKIVSLLFNVSNGLQNKIFLDYLYIALIERDLCNQKY